MMMKSGAERKTNMKEMKNYEEMVHCAGSAGAAAHPQRGAG